MQPSARSRVMQPCGAGGVCGGMKRAWIVANPTSGSVTEATAAAVTAAIEAQAVLAGRTRFPDEPMPSVADLDAAEVDTLVVLAGDGTINHAACRYSEWRGALLILPGGTMNLLAKALHGNAAAEEIVAGARAARAVSLPLVEAEGHCAFVGLILGPATSWNRARERLRAGKLRGMWRAVRHAWSRTMARRVRLEGVSGAAQAVFVRPDPDALVVRAVEAADWRSILELGWDWLTGDWVAASGVISVRRPALRVLGHRPVQALFDGELALLPPGAEMRVGESRPIFLQTAGERG